MYIRVVLFMVLLLCVAELKQPMWEQRAMSRGVVLSLSMLAGMIKSRLNAHVHQVTENSQVMNPPPTANCEGLNQLK